MYVTPSEDVEDNIPNTDLWDYVETLKRELEIHNEELRRKDHIIMSLTQRISELKATPEAREAPEAASGAGGRGEAAPKRRGGPGGDAC